MAQVVNHSGKEAGLGGAQQKSQDVERQRGPNKDHPDRDDAPTHHDPRDPATRSDSVQNEIARHFAQAIPEEKHAGTESKRGGAKSEIGIHLQRRKPDVHPIKPGHDVEDEDKRD